MDKLTVMNYKILTIIAAVALGAAIVAGIYDEQSFLQESILGGILEQYAEPDWSQINERDIVKNSIPIHLVTGDENGSCKVTAEHYNQIIEHSYFVKAEQLSEHLQYDATEKTLMIPCDQLMGDTSELHIWYVIAESIAHAEKYRYFITEWDK